MRERSEKDTKITFLFVGEERSKTAKEKDYTWDNVPYDGALCARKLFKALRSSGIEPREHLFVNIKDDNGNLQEIFPEGKVVIAMGLTVQRELAKRGISFIPIVHPAARGIWCRQEEYNQMVKNSLKGRV